MYSYYLTEKAKEDLLRIYEFGIARFGVEQADKYYEMMNDCFDKIVANPFLFPSVSNIKNKYFKCVCGVDTIYYKLMDNTIEIATIIGKQDFEIKNLVH